MKKILSLLAVMVAVQFSYAQSQITTTGNNVINSSNPYAADITIGSDASGGTRHDASIMWWSTGSASRISNSNDVFYYSVWNTTTPNIALGAAVGASSYFQGNVGIGTTSPASLLHLYSSAASNMLRLQFNASGGGSWSINPFIYGVSNGGLSFVNVQSSTIPFAIDASDNVGIGTTDPQGHKLAVNGDIIATKIKVKPYGNWPDYVFKPTYNLPSLTEVKSYIDQNQHLPDMPSAATVEKDGQDIGEMNKLLLKKVEELTLYVIKLQEQNDEIMKKLNASETTVK